MGRRVARGRRSHLREFRIVVGFAALVVAGSVTAGVIASARNSQASADEAAQAASVSCPSVADQLSDVPAAAADDVSGELQALENQVAEANARLASSAGEGGPNFVDNAILGPLRDKRAATLERIEIAIGRQGERPTGLQSLAECTLSTDAGDGELGEAEDTENTGDNADETDDPAVPGGALTVSCPSVADQLSEVPAAAAGDVSGELQALENQIAEANARLASSAGQGGPNFVDNAILGPLRDKRAATLERIEIAIGRQGERPTGLESLAECTVVDSQG